MNRLLWRACSAIMALGVPGCAATAPAPLPLPSPPVSVLPSDAPPPTVVRGQGITSANELQRQTPGSDDHYRQAMAASGPPGAHTPSGQFTDASVQPAQYTGAELGQPPGASGIAPAAPFELPGDDSSLDGPGPVQVFPEVGPIPPGPGGPLGYEPLPGQTADLIVNLEETQTGRFMFGVGVNSDAGLTAQIVIDEQNFDWRRVPRSFDDFINGTAFRGGGQRFRIEAIPGSQVQRYLVNFTEPYLFDTAVSLNLSGYLYDRRFYDWDEQRLGGRIGLGYRITPDLSLSVSTRLENVNISDPRVLGVMELDEVLGDNSLYTGGVTLTHDTRDIPFAATEGHLLELNFEQAFGTFDYPRGNVDYRRYFLIRERADGSGRHTLAATIQAGFSGSQTPIFENYFAGGYSTLRGFRFRHASPVVNGVIVGGEFSLLGSLEYLFPVTADDMLKGVFFADYGTVEEQIEINKDDFRVAVGFGLRVSVPAMGPAPIALDFAVPIAREDIDRIQNFSFFVGFGR